VIKRRRQLHAALFLGIGLAVSCLAVLAYELHGFKRLELTTVDTRFSIRGNLATPDDVVVVGVDDVTFGATHFRWPFSRDVQARVVNHLAAAGAKVIAEDIQYTEPTTPMPGCGDKCVNLANEQDNAIFLAVQRASARGSKVVLSTTEVGKDGSTNIFGGHIGASGARAANGLIPLDADGVSRRFPHEIQGLKTFAVVAAEGKLGQRVEQSAFPGTDAWIDYAGPPGRVPFISFSRVYYGTFDPASVRGKVVVVGATAPTLQDVHPTSTSGGENMSGPEIQANAIDTVLRSFPLKSAPSWLNILAIFVLGMVPALLALRFSAIWTIIGSLLLGGIYAVVAQLAFNHGRILAFVYPLAALAVSTVGALAVHYLLAAFERQRTRDTFARFVPEEVVNQVLTHTGEGLRLGGARVYGTCMFTDLRGSTQFAESLPPETVVEVINRYLGELTEAILGHGGTLISYLGDGFMAVFGAPIEQEDHADRAVAAAREILGERLPRFNEWLRAEGHGDGFRIGVGLNTGPFMAGNVGSEKRLEYTAMGDTINTASRLEGLTKGSDFYLLMADSTRDALVRPLDDVVPVGEVEVRGREAKLTVWSLEEARKPAAVPVA
jgi:adenylate cyclase